MKSEHISSILNALIVGALSIVAALLAVFLTHYLTTASESPPVVDIEKPAAADPIDAPSESIVSTQSKSGDEVKEISTPTEELQNVEEDLQVPLDSASSVVRPEWSTDSVKGAWLGSLETDSERLRLAIDVTVGAQERIKVVLTSIDQGGVDIPAEVASFNDGRFEFHTHSIRGSYRGVMNDLRNAIVGVWYQEGEEFPLNFHAVSEEQ